MRRRGRSNRACPSSSPLRPSPRTAQGRGRAQLDDDRRRRAADVVGQDRPANLERQHAEAGIPAALEIEARESAAAARIVDPADAAVEHHFVQGIQGAGVRRRQLGQRLFDRLRPQQDVLEAASEHAASRGGKPRVPGRDDHDHPRDAARRRRLPPAAARPPTRHRGRAAATRTSTPSRAAVSCTRSIRRPATT